MDTADAHGREPSLYFQCLAHGSENDKLIDEIPEKKAEKSRLAFVLTISKPFCFSLSVRFETLRGHQSRENSRSVRTVRTSLQVGQRISEVVGNKRFDPNFFRYDRQNCLQNYWKCKKKLSSD